MPDGSTVGSVGGGIMEHYTVQAAQKLYWHRLRPFCNACSFRLTAKTRMRPLLPVAASWRCCCRRFSPGRKQNEKGCLNHRARRRRPCQLEQSSTGCGAPGCGCWNCKRHGPRPSAVRWLLCEAVYEGETDVLRGSARCPHCETLEQAQSVWAQSAVPVLIDPEGACIARAKPDVVVDAILAKRNLGTCRNMAPLTIALGPGFVAGQDVDAVVETQTRPPAWPDHPGGERYPQYRHPRRYWRVRCRAGNPCTGQRRFYECAQVGRFSKEG